MDPLGDPTRAPRPIVFVQTVSLRYGALGGLSPEPFCVGGLSPEPFCGGGLSPEPLPPPTPPQLGVTFVTSHVAASLTRSTSGGWRTPPQRLNRSPHEFPGFAGMATRPTRWLQGCRFVRRQEPSWSGRGTWKQSVRASPPPSRDTVSVMGGPIGDWETAILWENHAGVQGAQMSTPYEL